jgi:hypothetical protein
MEIKTALHKITSFFNLGAGKPVLPASLQKLDGGAVPLDKALEIFDYLADQPDIAFGYSKNGCFASAHLLCRALQTMGLNPKKAWAFEDDTDTLHIVKLSIDKPNGEKTSWWFHVAAALPVTMPDGTVQDLVFDPAYYDGPVSLQEWGDKMGAIPRRTEIIPFGLMPKDSFGDYTPYTSTTYKTDAHAAKIMEDYLKIQNTEVRLVFPSQIRRQISQGQSIPPQGATWMTAPVTAPATPARFNRGVTQ